MEKIIREQLKQLFKKVKHFRLPADFDEIDFEKLHYLGWIDETDRIVYLVFKYKGELQGIRQCNLDLKKTDGLEKLFKMILE